MKLASTCMKHNTWVTTTTPNLGSDYDLTKKWQCKAIEKKKIDKIFILSSLIKKTPYESKGLLYIHHTSYLHIDTQTHTIFVWSHQGECEFYSIVRKDKEIANKKI